MFPAPTELRDPSIVSNNELSTESMVRSDLEDGTADQEPPSPSVVSHLHPDKPQYEAEALRIAGIYELLRDTLNFCHMIPCTVYMSAPKRVRFMLGAHNI